MWHLAHSGVPHSARHSQMCYDPRCDGRSGPLLTDTIRQMDSVHLLKDPYCREGMTKTVKEECYVEPLSPCGIWRVGVFRTLRGILKCVTTPAVTGEMVRS
ncbi:hypothetical protein NDU88_004143 [Pleurodeles waltl]|uniref:Uncharacterized protein n=1 Tax=Pleurodeles waltl TaxID=8319 RepID=A0AAV7RII8_PLEWA|nr:hypothetical protein NDU88_004143 [Pleurodeles waltl]